MIPYGRQWLNIGDRRSVDRVLRSARITQGPNIAQFEEKLAAFCAARYAVAATSGTAALHLAYLAAGLGPGQKVLTTPITFTATVNAAIYCGARPDFTDILPETFNMDPRAAERQIDRRTRIIAPVHLAGHPCRMREISSIARKKNLVVIEDACHALGARYRSGNTWRRVGSCAHSDAAVFSFHPVKSITTGEGGAVTTNRKDLYERMLLLRSHGMVKDPDVFKNSDLGFWNRSGKKETCPWYYEIQTLGFNYRITDFQCALGSSQLGRLDRFIKKRREIAAQYNRAFCDLDALRLPVEEDGYESAYHLYVIRLDLERLNCGRARIFWALMENGIQPQVHYVPLHYQPFFRRFGFRRGDFPNAERYYERAISLPIYPSLTSTQIKRTIRAVRTVIERFGVASHKIKKGPR